MTVTVDRAGVNRAHAEQADAFAELLVMMDQLPGNDYWAAVRPHVYPNPIRPGLEAGGLSPDDGWGLLSGCHMIGSAQRLRWCSRWSWTITDPLTVKAVASFCGPRVVDPLAGSGWWAHLLAGAGVDVVAADATPPVPGMDVDGNLWHPCGTRHHPIVAADARITAAAHGAERTLLLSWPPRGGDNIGGAVLDAYTGPRVVYLGELDPAGVSGDPDLFAALARDWVQVDGWLPVQWAGLRDVVVVYDRRTDTADPGAGGGAGGAVSGRHRAKPSPGPVR